MKKLTLILMAMVVTFSLAGCGNPCKENGLTKMGDSFATMGKDGMEKEKILAERAANRASQCAEKKAGEMKKKMGL